MLLYGQTESACLKFGKMDKFQTLLSSTAGLSAAAFQGMCFLTRNIHWSEGMVMCGTRNKPKQNGCYLSCVIISKFYSVVEEAELQVNRKANSLEFLGKTTSTFTITQNKSITRDSDKLADRKHGCLLHHLESSKDHQIIKL